MIKTDQIEMSTCDANLLNWSYIVKKGGIVASSPVIAIEPTDPRTVEIETSDMTLVDNFEVEVTASLHDGLGSLVYTHSQTFKIEVAPCSVNSFDSMFPLDVEYQIGTGLQETTSFGIESTNPFCKTADFTFYYRVLKDNVPHHFTGDVVKMQFDSITSLYSFDIHSNDPIDEGTYEIEVTATKPYGSGHD